MTKLISDPESYFNTLIPHRDDLLHRLEQEAQTEGIPIVGPVVGELLYILARSAKATRILELGTATGYSGIFLTRACMIFDGRLVTFEKDVRLAEQAKKNFRNAGLLPHVEIRTEDAVTAISSMPESFDMIFLDIEKQDYRRVLDSCHRLLRCDGLLVADNVAFREAETFNREIIDSPQWRSVHLFSLLPMHAPEKDGLCLAVPNKTPDPSRHHGL
jgi:caffeoyl-CoA O-methyltransferase